METISIVVGAGLLGAVLLPVAVVGVLGLLGFGAGGVIAGSVAAAIQSGLGNVAAGSLFAFAQSLAAGGSFLLPIFGSAISAALAGLARVVFF